MNRPIPVRYVKLFYHPESNRFTDEAGHTVFNFYPLVNPNMVALFKHKKQTMTFFNYRYKIRTTLLYPVNNKGVSV